MMRKITLLLATILVSSIAVNAQEKVDPKHTNYFKIPAEISTPEYSLTFSGAVARTEFCKFAVHIQNNTKDFLIFKGAESTFNFDFGTFTEKKKEVFVKPNGKKKKVLEANGGTQFHVDKYSVDIDGIYLVPVTGKVSEMKDFQVPASKNALSTDLFTVRLKKSSLKTQEAVLIFECTYLGDKIAIIDPSKLAIKVDDMEKEYANDNKKSDPRLLRKGSTIKLKAIFHIPGRIADMQFANMKILWKDTFVETEEQKLGTHSVQFLIDRGLTNGKN